MLKGFTPGKIYLATGFTDLRRGIDGLAGIIQEQFQLDAFNDTLFLFCGRRNDRIKGLYWDTNGFLLLYKRLESGSFRWPRTTQEALQITAQQYEWLCQAGKHSRTEILIVKTENFSEVFGTAFHKSALRIEQKIPNPSNFVFVAGKCSQRQKIKVFPESSLVIMTDGKNCEIGIFRQLMVQLCHEKR